MADSRYVGPERSMTGETVVRDGDGPQSPTETVMSGATIMGDGDAVISVYSEESASARAREERDLEQGSGKPEKDRRSFLSTINPFHAEAEPAHVTETNTRVLEETPNGYPRLAAFQASEGNFALYRGFNYLHSRVLLDMQDELTQLEHELDETDKADELDSDRGDLLKCREDDVAMYNDEQELDPSLRPNRPFRPRREILAEIKTKLYDYDKWLLKSRDIATFARPSDRNYRSVRRFMSNTKPLMDQDMDSIRVKEDIVSLRHGREWANFDGFVETSLQRIDTKILKPLLRTERPPLQTLFRTPELQAKTRNKYINYYSSSRIDRLVGLLITCIIFVLLVLPVLVMYRLSKHRTNKNTFDAVGVMVVFTLLFSAAMSLVTKAARHELFAASAAYCAILVVFIGNFAAD